MINQYKSHLVLGDSAPEELVEARGQRPHGAVVALRPPHFRTKLQLLGVDGQQPARQKQLPISI